jgi:hypothetical protein
MKIFFILFTLTILLFARENPFSPTKNKKSITTLSDTLPPLIKKSIDIKDIETDQIKIKPTWGKSIKVEKKIIKPNKIRIKPKKIVNKSHPKRTKVIYKNSFSTVKVSGNSILIVTKDKLLKDFIKEGQKQFILDFERFDVVKKSSKNIHSRYIKKLIVGYHGYYYRYIFSIKNRGNYTVKKTKYGYKINLYR